MNRLTEHAKKIQAIIDQGGLDGALDTPEKLEEFERSQDLTFEEHFGFQETQARAHAMQKITTEEAQTIYNALGEGMSDKNGGWQPHVTLAMKVTITQTIGALHGVRA